jgi:hypothetical protein
MLVRQGRKQLWEDEENDEIRSGWDVDNVAC